MSHVEVVLIAKCHAPICGLKDIKVILILNKIDLTNINGGINKYGEIYDENIPFIWLLYILNDFMI